MKDGKEASGYFYYSTEDSLTFKFTDEEFALFVDRLFRGADDTLILYRKLHTLKYPEIPPSGEGQYQFQAAAKEDILKLTRKDILTSYFIGFLPPDEWNVDHDHWFFECNGQYVIQELAENEIALLQQKPVAQYSYACYNEYSSYDYHLVSYNTEIGEGNLTAYKEQLRALSKVIAECKKPDTRICYEKEYMKIKEDLRSKKVILIHINGAN